MTNYCPYTRTAFEKNISDLSHLSECKFRFSRFCPTESFILRTYFWCSFQIKKT
jgi:hypothetical protein